MCEAVHISPPSSSREPTRKYSISLPTWPGVDHVGALAQQALAVARRELGRAQAHVASQADAQLRHGLAGELAEHVRERTRRSLGDVAVDLLAVEAADVVGLEDLGGGAGAHVLAHPSGPARGSSQRLGVRVLAPESAIRASDS